jgi:RNA polymerase sigma-70 factor (ECF subfamily)
LTAKAIDPSQSFHSPNEVGERVSSTGTAQPESRDFETIYRQHYAPVWRFLRHLGVPMSDVADVTHNVFLVAHRKLGEFEGRSSLRTWLCGIAWRVGRDYLRSSAVRLEVSATDAFDVDAPAPDDSADALRQRRQLALALSLLAALPEDQREVFVLHELEQLTGPEIAQLMGTPVNTVRSRLKRARDTFQKRLGELREQGAVDV